MDLVILINIDSTCMSISPLKNIQGAETTSTVQRAQSTSRLCWPRGKLIARSSSYLSTSQKLLDRTVRWRWGLTHVAVSEIRVHLITAFYWKITAQWSMNLRRFKWGIFTQIDSNAHFKLDIPRENVWSGTDQRCPINWSVSSQFLGHWISVLSVPDQALLRL